MKNILVAIDFDDYTPRLVKAAVDHSKAFGAKLWFIHIAPTEPEFVGYEQGPQYIRDGFAEELREEHRQLQDLCKTVREQGIDAEGLMVQGPTLQMITEEAEKLKVDLIITCTHKRSFFYKAFFGSVSTDIFESSNIPVLSIPATKEE